MVSGQTVLAAESIKPPFAVAFRAQVLAEAADRDGMQIQANTSEHVPTADPQGWSKRFIMPVFRQGVQVKHAGRWETVDYVKLRRLELLVYLVGHAEPVRTRELELAPTLFTTERVPAAQNLGYTYSL